MKSVNGAIKYVVMVVVATVSIAIPPTPALAGSNGQQISIYACGAGRVTVQGYDQNNQWQVKTLNQNPAKHAWLDVTGWWWKGNVDVYAYYYVTLEYPYYLGQTALASVPASQKDNDWVSINIPAPSAQQFIQWRATTWVKDAVPYDSRKHHDGFRQDSTGYISFAWNLSKSYTGDMWRDFANQIRFENLQPGDALDNPQKGTLAHMILFMGWVDQQAGTFVGFEESSRYGSARKSIFTLNRATGAIADGTYRYPGSYIAITRK